MNGPCKTHERNCTSDSQSYAQGRIADRQTNGNANHSCKCIPDDCRPWLRKRTVGDSEYQDRCRTERSDQIKPKLQIHCRSEYEQSNQTEPQHRPEACPNRLAQGSRRDCRAQSAHQMTQGFRHSDKCRSNTGRRTPCPRHLSDAKRTIQTKRTMEVGKNGGYRGNRSLAPRATSPEGWRRGWDSNPRYAVNVYSLSRGAPSATRPPLHRRVCPSSGAASRGLTRKAGDFLLFQRFSASCRDSGSGLPARPRPPAGHPA